ncbi:MAG: hypothetical protein JWO67_3977 [Streptosporangiaceae bacterium]|nr:hypothetical protein [Streptosporangiaceae bacterium]
MTENSDLDRVVIHPRLPGHLHARLKAYAKADNRTMNAVVNLAITEYLDRHETLAENIN